MIILLDCDGVLADFVGHMLTRLRALGHPMPEEDALEYDFLRSFGDGAGLASKMLLADPAHWKAMPPYEDAQTGVKAIRKAGHEVVVVTSPWLSCEPWAHVRRGWLKKHFAVEHGDLIVTSRKELVRGDVFIDDRHESVTAWDAANDGRAILMDRSWTKSGPAHLERWSWEPERVDNFLFSMQVPRGQPIPLP